MRKKLGYFVFLVFLIIGTVLNASELLGIEMSKNEVKQRWGSAAFNAEKFKNGDRPARATMAFSLLEKPEVFIGKPISLVREQLGSYDGYYISDWIPCYLIYTAEKKGEDSWQLVFLPDKNRNVSKIIVHKNGSYRLPSMMY